MSENVFDKHKWYFSHQNLLFSSSSCSSSICAGEWIKVFYFKERKERRIQRNVVKKNVNKVDLKEKSYKYIDEETLKSRSAGITLLYRFARAQANEATKIVAKRNLCPAQRYFKRRRVCSDSNECNSFTLLNRDDPRESLKTFYPNNLTSRHSNVPRINSHEIQLWKYCTTSAIYTRTCNFAKTLLPRMYLYLIASNFWNIYHLS